MDLSAIYSKTPKGLRARALLIGGLSSHLMKVLTHVDGSSSAETILQKFNKLTPQQLTADLTQLAQEGYIRLATVTSTADDSWSLTVNFEPMVVEEFQSEEELEVSAQAKTAEQTRQIELEQAKQEEERRLATQLKADKIAHKLRDKERIKAETKVIAQLEQERLALEAARQEAEKVEQQQAAERAAKLAEETRLKLELKAREVAEQAEAEAAAKENARREIERISREAEETQKKADIEAKAKQESERLEALKLAKAAEDARQAELKAQAEYQAQLEQAAKAAAEQARIEVEAAAQAAEIERLEIATALRKAEEDRKNAAAQAEAEKLEAKRQLKAEQDARAQAERKAQAEYQAQLEQAAMAAAEQARVETEAAAQAAEIERLEIATALRKAEEDRKNAVAQAEAEKLEAQRQLKAEQDARAQAERKAKEESKEFARQQKLKAQAEDFEAAEEAAFEAEERAAEAETHRTLEKTTKQATVDTGRTDIKNAAMTAAAAMASIHGKVQSFISAKRIKQWLGLFTKVAFIYLPVLLLLVLLVLNFINLSFLIKPIEQMASESIGETVVIKKVHASLWPQPNLVLEDVAIGTGNNIEAVHVLPVIVSLFEEVKVVKSLVIEGLSIEQANFSQPLQWVSNASKAKRLKVEQINLKNLTLVIRDLQLEPLDGKVTLTDAGALSSIELVSSNNALSVQISPQGNDSEIVLKATNWALPFNQKIVFDVLNAKGLASQYKLNFSQIEGEIFGGSLTGQANIEWPDSAGQWLSAGEFKLSNANTEALLNNFGSAVTIEGKLALDARFSAEASEVSKLASNTITDANFDVRQGSIQRIELVRGVLSPSGQSLAGDNTNFDKLTGSIKLNQNQYQFNKLVLASSQFNVYGFINIDANQILTGKVHADLAAPSRRLKASFGITGRGEDLRSN
ncbi:MAG TPA: AsmA-like C-terminal region-containing protein [Methylotenera sp.]|nr:AsmA-like C-terminal region-containing protein [Methylotenera sp.]